MKAEFSEFSYGFALTREIVGVLGKRLLEPPLFPSLLAEGKKGGGYDVMLQGPAKVILLQFKLAEYMKRPSSLGWAYFKKPFLRFELRTEERPSTPSQHELLMQHEEEGDIVYYAAPRFHSAARFHKAFFAGDVIEESAFVRPGSIGALSATDKHRVAFFPDARKGIVFSEPVEIDILLFQSVQEHIIGTGNIHDNIEERLVALDRRLLQIGQEQDADSIEGWILELPAIRRVVLLARIVLGAEILVVKSQTA